jgi:hypothetical protein
LAILGLDFEQTGNENVSFLPFYGIVGVWISKLSHLNWTVRFPTRRLKSTLPPPQQRPFWLLGIDRTPAPRRFAVEDARQSVTLPDRTFVYQPNTLRGNKPVTIGHDYSILAVLPEKITPAMPPWLIPLLVRRVTSAESALSVGVEQITALVTDQTLPFHEDLCVQPVLADRPGAEDSSYSGIAFLGPVAQLPNLVSIVRLPGNRKVYHSPEPQINAIPSAGHPTWYGAPFVLADPQTWSPPDVVAQTTFTTRRGQTYTVRLEGWYHMLRRGTKDVRMHEHPFTLVRAQAEALPRPWERYLPSAPKGSASPATVQRDFQRIIRQIGTPAQVPKRRGNPPGRARGTRLTPRQRHPVIKKSPKRPAAAPVPGHRTG